MMYTYLRYSNKKKDGVKLIKNIFKKKPQIFYSCVIDDDPKFYWQGCIFLNSLTKLAKVSGDRIFVHMIGKNKEFEIFLSQNNINMKYIEPWGGNKYCNKLKQLENEQLKRADFVFFCDADIAIVKDLAFLVHHSDEVLGKVVDFDNPNIKTLKELYDLFKVDYPKLTYDTLNTKPTFETNFNGGLYGIPTRFIGKFSLTWKIYADKMLNSDLISQILGKKIIHIDQISFSLALKTLQFKYKLLSYKHNCPSHIEDTRVLDNKLNEQVEVIHYHSNVSNIGLLNLVGISYIDKTIRKINEVVENDFNSTLFWNRYKNRSKSWKRYWKRISHYL